MTTKANDPKEDSPAVLIGMKKPDEIISDKSVMKKPTKRPFPPRPSRVVRKKKK
jgi:hypothetical protein